MKKLALRSMLILFVVVFVSILFGKTLETLSTAKARFITPSTGRLLNEVKLDAKLVYKDETNVIPEVCKKYPVVINAVYFNAGNTVDKDDVILEASIVDYDKKLKEINDNTVKKTAELLDLDSKNARFPTRSDKADRYFALKKASEALISVRTEAKSKAKIENREADPKEWEKEQKEYNKAYEGFVQYSRVSTPSDEGFDYIVKRHDLIEELSSLEKDAEELSSSRGMLSEYKAIESGIITELALKPGETYDGTKALYKYNKKDVAPVLRCMITDLDSMPEKGDKGIVKLDYDKVNLKVTDKGKTKDGQRYIDFELDENTLSRLGGVKRILAMEKLEITVQKRSAIQGSIIPASALRSEGERTFVYGAEYKSNGLLGGYNVVKEQDVRVIARNETQVSVAEDLYFSVLDREDRPLKKGIRILEIQE